MYSEQTASSNEPTRKPSGVITSNPFSLSKQTFPDTVKISNIIFVPISI